MYICRILSVDRKRQITLTFF